MRKMSKFEKLGVVAAIIVASSFIYMKKVYEPQEKRLKATVAQLNKVIGEVNSLNTVKSVSTIKKELDKKKQELADLNERMGRASIHADDERQVSELLSKISRIIEKSGLSVNYVKPDGKKPDDLFHWSSFEFDLAGGYFQFLRFLDSLRALPDALKVGKMELEQGKGNSLHITLELML
jgi:Tfp pilus assembly protein PilO